MNPKLVISVLSLALLLFGTACGSGNDCTSVLGVTPKTAVAYSYVLNPSGDSVTFKATQSYTGTRCPLSPVAIGNVNANWTSSDTTNVKIVNSKTDIGIDGFATCLSATPSPDIITATAPDGKKASATLTCQ